jgi:hypothetical protein
MSRPIIRTTGGPNRRRRRDLTVLGVVCFLLIAGLLVYLEFFRHPHAAAAPASAVSAGLPAFAAPAAREA